jgi:hypothetical protein
LEGNVLETALWGLIRALSHVEAGRDCRCCRQPIVPAEAFGIGEGVCAPCRTESDA